MTKHSSSCSRQVLVTGLVLLALTACRRGEKPPGR